MEDIKEKYEEVRSAKQEAVRELLTLQEQHKAELRILTNSQMEEAIARENLERKLCEIRSEVRMRNFTYFSIQVRSKLGVCIQILRLVGTFASRKCS